MIDVAFYLGLPAIVVLALIVGGVVSVVRWVRRRWVRR